MRLARVAGSVLIALLMSSVMLAQVPNLSGKWTLASDPAAGGGFGGVGREATITQDAATMTIKRSTQWGEFTSTYKLDGSESRNTITLQGNTIDQTSKVRAEGEKLTIDTSMTFDGNPVTVSMTMWLDPSGMLTVQSTRPDFQGGGGPVTTTTTYKKS